MQARRVINFYSKDLLIVFKVELGNKNLIQAVIAKIARLYNIAAKDKLAEIDEKIAVLIKEMSKDLKKIKDAANKQAINNNNTKFIVLKREQFIFGNNTVFNLLRLIEICDLYFAYLSLSKTTMLFNKKAQTNSFSKIKRKKLFSLLSNIATISLKNYA